MKRTKLTIVGAGNVGASAAHIAAMEDFADIVLIDIVDGLAKGKALDIRQCSSISGFGSALTGTTQWADAAESDIVIITSGMPRKPGMSRDDLVAKNTEIVQSVSENIKTHCPNAAVIVVCNPLDAMVHAAWKVTGFEQNRVMGMAGALDTGRYIAMLSDALKMHPENIQAVLMGGHGDSMVPLPRFTCVSGIPVTELLEKGTIDEIIERTRKGGIEIVNLLGYSAYYAPAAGAVKMARAIALDEKKLFCACAWCGSEYEINSAFIGVPCILGAGGVERIVELDLMLEEKEALAASVGHVKELVKKVETML